MNAPPLPLDHHYATFVGPIQPNQQQQALVANISSSYRGMKASPLSADHHYAPFVAPIYPNPQQQHYIAKTSGCCRYVYNTLLRNNSASYEVYKANIAQGINTPKPRITYPELCRQLTILRHNTVGNDGTHFLLEVSCVALQQAVKDLYDGFQNFFTGRAGYPKPKKRSRRQSFTMTTRGFQMHDGDIHLGNIPGVIPVGYGRKHHIRQMPSTPSSVTIVRKPTGEYHASFTCIARNKPTKGKDSIGVDVGLATFVTTSNGKKYPNPKHYRAAQAQLRRVDKDLARSKPGSKRHEQLLVKRAKLHARIVNQRNDHHHKLSKRLVAKHKVINIEDLNVKGMAQHPTLAKSVHDAAWAKFIGMLKYKAFRTGGTCTIIEVDRWLASTHICNHCGTKRDTKLKLSERTWQCDSCHTSHDRDINAAKVIHASGVRIIHNKATV